MATSTTAEPHILCSQCRHFLEQATCLNFTPEELLRGGDGVPQMPQYLELSHRRSAILASAASGCHFCSVVIGASVGCTGEHADRQFCEDADGPVYAWIDILSPSAGSFSLSLLYHEQASSTPHDQFLSDHSLELRPLQAQTAEAIPINLQWQQSSLGKSTFSTATAGYIKSWIDKCRSSHTLCGNDIFDLLIGSGEARVWPKRLLDLKAFDDLERIRLVEVQPGSYWDYCALSYSWGHGPRFLMTSSNIADFLDEIRVQEMPSLLRDAIQVTRDIGFRYFWVDALCMMQDGKTSLAAWSDWNEQIKKMKDIFGNAIVTIAASECFDGTEHLIRPRNPLGQLNCRLDINTKLRYEVVPSCTPHCLKHPFDKARYHLDTRAWVFQERILTPRTLHFTRNFIHLECRTELRCEAVDGVEGCHHSGTMAKADYFVLFSIYGFQGIIDASTRDAFLSGWHELVRRFSTMNLSRKEDFLIAMGGLSLKIQSKLQITWSFGLWREFMLQGMAWYVRCGSGMPQRWRAPTWSWASIEVDGPQNRESQIRKIQEVGPQIMFEPARHVTLLAEIVAVPDETDFERHDRPYVDAKKHSIKVAGLLKPGSPDLVDYQKKNGSGTSHDVRTHRSCRGHPDLHRLCPFHPDHSLIENATLYSLLIACASGSQKRGDVYEAWDTHVGLVLTPALGNGSRYHRVGYFHIDMLDETEYHDDQVPWVLKDARWTEVEII